jgi:hypothetical protein
MLEGEGMSNHEETNERQRRPKQDGVVVVRIDRKLLRNVDRVAAESQTTRSELVRRFFVELVQNTAA